MTGIGGQGSEGPYFTGIDGFGCDANIGLACFGTDFATPVTVTPVAGRHVFSSAGLLAGSGGIAGADALCQREATAAGLANPTHFLAALATSTASISSRFNLAGAPWVRTDGVLAAATPADFMAGKLVAPPSPNASGVIPGAELWGGSTGGLTVPAASGAENCSDWSSASATATGVLLEPIYGGPDVASAFTAFGTLGLPCNGSQGVLCLEN